MTNFGKIKNMSIEDMAMIIMCPYDGVADKGECPESYKNCVQCCKDWLEREADDCET